MTTRRTLARAGAICGRCTAVWTLHLDSGRHPAERPAWIEINRRSEEWLVHPDR